MTEIFAALISFFLLSPLESAISRQLEGANAPRAAVSAALGCVRSSTPAIADRLVENPMWAAWQVYDVWIGGKSPEAVVLEIAPSCAGPMNLLKPYLDGAARA